MAVTSRLLPLARPVGIALAAFGAGIGTAAFWPSDPDAIRLASEGSSAVGWAPAPLLALAIVASASGMVLLLGFGRHGSRGHRRS